MAHALRGRHCRPCPPARGGCGWPVAAARGDRALARRLLDEDPPARRGRGQAEAFVLSGGERHESLYLEALLAGGSVRRAGRGRPRMRPGQVVGDKGYSYPAVRGALARRGIRAVIPRRRDESPDDRRHRPFDRAVYRQRNRVERLINRLKQCRRVATRYEKRARHYLAMLTVDAALLWL